MKSWLPNKVEKYPFEPGSWVVWGDKGEMGQVKYFTNGCYYTYVRVTVGKKTALIRKKTGVLRQLDLNIAA